MQTSREAIRTKAIDLTNQLNFCRFFADLEMTSVAFFIFSVLLAEAAPDIPPVALLGLLMVCMLRHDLVSEGRVEGIIVVNSS